MIESVEEVATEDPIIPIEAPPGEDPGVVLGDRPLHLARCADCRHTVRFQPLPSGFGFTLPDESADGRTYGIGASGRPLCPDGHGEMGIADDALPAHEAIGQVAEKVNGEAIQQSLPGVVPEFNFRAAWLEVEQQAVEVERLKADYDDAASEARDAKKAWEKAADLFVKMTVELRRRRQDKLASAERSEAAPGQRCTWEQQHPGEVCPVCHGTDTTIMGGVAPATAAQHAEEIDAHILTQEIEALDELLQQIGMIIPASETLRGWTPEERTEVRRYAEARRDGADPLPARPACLGTMHVVADTVTSEVDGYTSIFCELCDQRLQSYVTGENPIEFYLPGTLVGTDCPGKPKAEGHRYPKRGKKAAAKGRKK